MDTDDIAAPNRFELQLREIKKSTIGSYRRPIVDLKIQLTILLGKEQCLAHK